MHHPASPRFASPNAFSQPVPHSAAFHISTPLLVACLAHFFSTGFSTAGAFRISHPWVAPRPIGWPSRSSRGQRCAAPTPSHSIAASVIFHSKGRILSHLPAHSHLITPRVLATHPRFAPLQAFLASLLVTSETRARSGAAVRWRLHLQAACLYVCMHACRKDMNART